MTSETNDDVLCFGNKVSTNFLDGFVLFHFLYPVVVFRNDWGETEEEVTGEIVRQYFTNFLWNRLWEKAREMLGENSSFWLSRSL